MKKALTLVIVAALTLAAVAGLVGCGKQSTGFTVDESGVTHVKVGVIGDNTEWWNPAIEALREQNIEIEFVSYGQYNLVNAALDAGDIACNAFQHYAYLNKDIADNGYNICAIGETIVAPLRLFSVNISSIDGFKEGDSIAIPSDATNGGRSLRLLEAAGLITIKADAGALPDTNDIESNPLNLNIVAVDASLTASLITDYAAVIINGQNALDNNIAPDSAIFVETVTENNKDYVNIIAARTEDKDNEVLLAIVAAFRTQATAEALAEVTQGAYVPAFDYES